VDATGMSHVVSLAPGHLHRRQLDDQVNRIGEILQGKPELTIGPITVGPHA